MARRTKYRMVTPPHMDVTLCHFKSQDEAVDEAKRRGAYHRTMLYVLKIDGEWLLIFDSEKGGNV